MTKSELSIIHFQVTSALEFADSRKENSTSLETIPNTACLCQVENYKQPYKDMSSILKQLFSHLAWSPCSNEFSAILLRCCFLSQSNMKQKYLHIMYQITVSNYRYFFLDIKAEMSKHFLC